MDLLADEYPQWRDDIETALTKTSITDPDGIIVRLGRIVSGKDCDESPSSPANFVTGPDVIGHAGRHRGSARVGVAEAPIR